MTRYTTLVLFLSIIALNFAVLSLRRYFARRRGAAMPHGKVSRLIERLKNPEWRRYGLILLGGKLAGLALVVAAAFYFEPGLFGHKVFAADAVLRGNDIVNPVNTAWTLIAAFLVFGMQVGFTMLEAGFCRSRETVNVLMECIVDTCLCGISLLRHRASPSCSATATASSAITGSSCKARPRRTRPPALPSLRSGSSSSPSPIPAPPSPPAR